MSPGAMVNGGPAGNVTSLGERFVADGTPKNRK